MTAHRVRRTLAASAACAGIWSVAFRVFAPGAIGNADLALLALLGMLSYGAASTLLESSRPQRFVVTVVTLSSAAVALWLTHGRRDYHLAIYAVTPAVMCAASWVAHRYLAPISLGVGAITIGSAIVFSANQTAWIRAASLLTFVISSGYLASRSRRA